ncbi:MAG: alpha-amylase [Spirochaetaceae bacterium]|jgi:glycosidase|nr:alpha-amylase [Spirochaetaceae bacterium]
MKKHPTFEFHIAREIRDEYKINKTLFSITGDVIFADFKTARDLAFRISTTPASDGKKRSVKAGDLIAMGLIDEILHYMIFLYRSQGKNDVFITALNRFKEKTGENQTENLLSSFCEFFPPRAVYGEGETVQNYLNGQEAGYSRRPMTVEEILLLFLANLNAAFNPFKFFFDDQKLKKETVYEKAMAELKTHLSSLPSLAGTSQSLWDLLRAPALASSTLTGQLRWMMENWGSYLGRFISRLHTSIDIIAEEEKPNWFGAPGPSEVYDFGYLASEYERFSSDREWMPSCVIIAKSTLVWLDQLSKLYKRDIKRLDQIPDEAIDELSRRGFTGLWLIGLWERSRASRVIKQWKGNSEAAASAYSLYDYNIAEELGGWNALFNLRDRCARRGVRLGSDMVPNHTGIDSRWIMENPDRFLQLDYPPFPGYTYNSGNLSADENIVVQIEDHYYDNSDCAVVFHHYDKRSGRRRYIYHGNDGTSMPWNDTAQIDFLNPEAREAVIQTIIEVCRQFPIVRFDAAMTLAKKHIQRLWYPEGGKGGGIASRAEHSISTEEFNARIPNEFWREVVDRCAREAPDTLLLAEAFWMMEGYFVRTLGMHRVYNSAFMNMLKKEENQKYRETIKNTLQFDPEILKRFVNFMNNPDEDTAVAQFGKGDKYIAVCVLMVTMPGLPMFGHGQIEGFEEKYGMEYRKAYRDETPDQLLVERHEKEIFPLMKKRYIFSGSTNFFLFDFWAEGNCVNENVFAYTNRAGEEKSLVFVNNSYREASGWIKESPVDAPQKEGGFRRDSLAQALLLHNEAPYFILMREHRTNRWFIRSSKEIHEKGLFVILKGYEAQVYLDFQEVRDEEFNTWARLNAETKGASFSSPDEALRDMLLGPLYGAFFKAVDAYVNGVGAYANGAEYEKETLSFYKEAVLFMNGTPSFLSYHSLYAETDGPGAPETGVKQQTEKTASQKKSGAAPSAREIEKKEISHEILQKEFNAFLKTIKFHDKAPESAGEKEAKARAFAFAILYVLESVKGTGALKKDAPLVCEHFYLDKKLSLLPQNTAPSNFKTQKTAQTVKFLFKNLASPKKKSPASFKDAASLLDFLKGFINKNRADPSFKELFGINVFEGTVYFNKECFEYFLETTQPFLSAFVPENLFKKALNGFKKACEKSDYKLENFIKNLDF